MYRPAGFIKTTVRSLAFGAIFLVAASAAHAGSFAIDYNTGTDSADLFLTTTNAPANGPFTVTGITGERDGVTITGLSSYASADQLVLATTPWFDYSGLSYSTGSGASEIDYNLFTDSDGANYELSSAADPGGFSTNEIPLTSIAVAEPTSLALIGVGFLGLGLVVRRRRTSAFA